MKKYKAALFIGRFQPFHNGHLYSLKKCLELAEQVIVVVGSSQEEGTESNPWGYEVRKRMIESLPGVSRKVEVVAVPDVFNDEKWGRQIIEIIQSAGYLPSEVIGVGNNDWTNRILRQIGVEVYESGLYNRDELEGIKIRELMRQGEPGWKKRVPEVVVQYLDEHSNAGKN